MKLVEILAKELKEWPEGYTRIVQTIKELNLPIDNEDVRYLFDQWDYSDVSSRIYDAEFETSELADDYQTAIVTKQMWAAEKAKMSVQSTPIEAESFNPIHCRDRIKEIDSIVESLEEERVSLVQALEDEGFSLIEKINKQLEDCKQSHEDMSDPNNWREGDYVRCLIDHGSQFTEGELYTLSHTPYARLAEVDEDDEGDPNGLDTSQFKWHSRPQ